MKKLALLVLVSTPAIAQEGEPVQETVEVRFKERTEIIFDGLKVDGSLVGPDIKMVTPPPRARDFNPLIRLRQSFSAEMKESVDAVK